MCRKVRTDLKMESLSRISNGNQDRSVNISWERNYATWRKCFHFKYIDFLTYLLSRLTVMKTFHLEHGKKKKDLKYSYAMARSNMEYKILHTQSLFVKKSLMTCPAAQE